jgi:NAD+ kinase
MLTEKKVNHLELPMRIERIGILYHPLREKAQELAKQLQGLLSSKGISVWQCSTREEETARLQCINSHLILSIGGDGTVLRVARIAALSRTPILGIKLGRLGFNTEVNSDEIAEMITNILEGKGWIEQRAMLETHLDNQRFHALNDTVIRGSSPRLINIEISIDGVPLSTCRADGIILATSTGSTGYSLAAGGPILHPQSREFVLKPICCHLGPSTALVLLPENIVDLRLSNGDRASLILDGQIEIPISSEQNITVKLSSHVTQFLRFRPREYFFHSLWQRLQVKGVL